MEDFAAVEDNSCPQAAPKPVASQLFRNARKGSRHGFPFPRSKISLSLVYGTAGGFRHSGSDPSPAHRRLSRAARRIRLVRSAPSRFRRQSRPYNASKPRQLRPAPVCPMLAAPPLDSIPRVGGLCYTARLARLAETPTRSRRRRYSSRRIRIKMISFQFSGSAEPRFRMPSFLNPAFW